MKTLVLIDGHAILHRAYHAFPLTLKTRRGEIVNAVYGFTRILLTVLDNLKPDYLAVAFDLPYPTFRHYEFIGYQAHRPESEKEFREQIERVYEVVKVLNIPIFSQRDFEADDVIGTLAKEASKRKNLETIIVTGDKDIMQLVDKKVKVYAPQKGFAQGEIFDYKKVKALLGVFPKQIIDYKALVGDPSDNYPGVPGIGPKTAVLLLRKYKNLKNIFKNLKKINPTVAQKIETGRESALLSQKLATIVRNVSIRLNLKKCQVHDYDRQKAMRLFEELEFRSLIKRLPGEKKKEEKEKAKTKQNKQMALV
jgi:DNA polymerase-1